MTKKPKRPSVGERIANVPAWDGILHVSGKRGLATARDAAGGA